MTGDKHPNPNRSFDPTYIYYEPTYPPPHPDTFRQRQHNIPLLIGLNGSQRLHPSLRNAHAAHPTNFRSVRFSDSGNEMLHRGSFHSKIIQQSPIDVNVNVHMSDNSQRPQKNEIQLSRDSLDPDSHSKLSHSENENNENIPQPLHWNMTREQTLASFAARSHKPPSISTASDHPATTHQTSLLEYLPHPNSETDKGKEKLDAQKENVPGEKKLKKRKVRSKKRTKKKLQKTTDTNHSSLSSSPSVSNISAESLMGIEECGFLNAGQSLEALDIFLQSCRASRVLAWTMVYADITSPLDDDVKRKEKTCDPPVFAALFVLQEDNDLTDGENNNTNSDCFLLPLCRCTNNEDIIEKATSTRMNDWPIAPFECGVSLLERWKVLRTILTIESLTCITFNARRVLLPLHQHQEYDLRLQLDDLLLKCRTYDILLAAWMLRPHATDNDLSFSSIASALSRLNNSNVFTTVVPQHSSTTLVGLCRIKDKLSQLLLYMYPAVNPVLVKKGLSDAFYKLESALQSLLCALECTGIGFLPAKFSSLHHRLENRISELTLEARQISGDEKFICSSPQQVSHLLYDVLKLPVPIENPNSTKHRSTSETALEEIKKHTSHRIVDILLEFRMLHKLLTSFVQPLPCLARKHEEIFRIHPIWMQTAVRTGRLSCRKPNMQQIPNEVKAFNVHPRDAFCATRRSACLFSFDYSQNEVRILAHVSGDTKLLSLFNNDNAKDIYQEMSSLITGKPIEAVSANERAITKQVVLAILYGMGVPQVASKLGISRESAQQFFNSFYNRFHETKRWIESVKSSVRKCGFITTIVGRRRYLEDIRSTDNKKRAQAERQAVNSIIQGSAADLMKLAMLKISSYIVCKWKKYDEILPKPRMLLQIHDELLFEVTNKPSEIQQLKNAVFACCADECRKELKLKIPLKLSCSVGDTWGSMKSM